MKKVYEYVGAGVDHGTDFTYQITPKYLGELEVGSKFKVLYCDISDGGMVLCTSFEKNLDDEQFVKELVIKCYLDECDKSDKGDAGDITYYISEFVVNEENIDGGDVLWERELNWIDGILYRDQYYWEERKANGE